MIVHNTRKINERISYYADVEQINSIIARTFAVPIENYALVPDVPAQMDIGALEMQKTMLQCGKQLSFDEAVIATICMYLLDDSEENTSCIPDEVIEQIVKHGHVFHHGDIEENPYYKNIRIEPHTCGRFTLDVDNYKKYELFPWNTEFFTEHGFVIPPIGTTDHKIKFPILAENGLVWMSISLNEIYTMRKPIEQALGNVLVFGCGLGYFAYMAALKDTVSHVTIVEKQPEVIELFTNYILPQFSCKDKITVIQGDAFDYIKDMQDGEYDFCFVDIWSGIDDPMPYLRMKALCRRFQTTTMSYWLEDAIAANLTTYVFVQLLISLYQSQGAPEQDFTEDREDGMETIQYIENLLKDVTITRPEQIDELMNPRHLIKMIERYDG